MKSLALILFACAAVYYFVTQDRVQDETQTPASIAEQASSSEAGPMTANPEASPASAQRIAENPAVAPPATEPENKSEIPQSTRKVELAKWADLDLQAAGCTFNSRKIEGTDHGVIDDELNCSKDGNPELQRVALQKYIHDLTDALKESTPGEDNSAIFNKAANAGDALATMTLAGLPQDEAREDSPEN